MVMMIQPPIKCSKCRLEENFVLTQATGQLIRTGVFEAKAFSEAVPFKLAFKMQRNPDMTKNGRFPTAVSNFKYEPAH